MKHKGTIELDTERLTLRRFNENDVPKMYENWASDRLVTRYLTWEAHERMEMTQTIVDLWISDYRKNDFYQWAIVLTECDELVGNVSVVNINESISECEIGYCIGKKWWNKGITTEACKAVIAFLFEQVGANRISAKHHTENVASGQVMKKCGLTYEGTLRQAGITGTGEICDLAYYSILRKEALNHPTNV